MNSHKRLWFPTILVLLLILLSAGSTARAAVTHKLLVDASAFHPTTEGYVFENWGNFIVNEGTGKAWFVAKVYLPNNAKILKLKLYAFDDSAANMCLWLTTTKPASAFWTDMGMKCSSGASATNPRVFGTGSFSPNITHTGSNTYHLAVAIGPGSTKLKFWGAQIVYEK